MKSTSIIGSILALASLSGPIGLKTTERSSFSAAKIAGEGPCYGASVASSP